MALAEREGFEPSNGGLPRYFLSREAPSTRLGHLSSIRSCYRHSSELRISGEEASYFLQYRYPQSWRDGRADECAGLENQWAFAGPGGSNPPPYALQPTEKSSIQIQFSCNEVGIMAPWASSSSSTRSQISSSDNSAAVCGSNIAA